MSNECLEIDIFAMVINYLHRLKKRVIKRGTLFFLHKKKRHLVALFRLGIRTLV